MNINLFSIFFICGFSLGGIPLIVIGIFLRRKTNNLIEKCISSCRVF